MLATTPAPRHPATPADAPAADISPSAAGSQTWENIDCAT